MDSFNIAYLLSLQLISICSNTSLTFNCVHTKLASLTECTSDHHQRFFIIDRIKFLLLPYPIKYVYFYCFYCFLGLLHILTVDGIYLTHMHLKELRIRFRFTFIPYSRVMSVFSSLFCANICNFYGEVSVLALLLFLHNIFSSSDTLFSFPLLFSPF